MPTVIELDISNSGTYIYQDMHCELDHETIISEVQRNSGILLIIGAPSLELDYWLSEAYMALDHEFCQRQPIADGHFEYKHEFCRCFCRLLILTPLSASVCFWLTPFPCPVDVINGSLRQF